MKDPNRLFGELDRTLLFFRQKGLCAVCDGQMVWEECEVHHVDEHSKGGATSLENGAAVHKVCHPKGVAATAAFAEKFALQKQNDVSLI
jgi:5-methylcytosine-specific restriction endonuclease McrA